MSRKREYQEHEILATIEDKKIYDLSQKIDTSIVRPYTKKEEKMIKDFLKKQKANKRKK